MGDVWAEAVRRSLDESLDLLDAAARGCPEERWCAPIWRVDPADIVGEVYDGDGVPLTDPERRTQRVQRWSQPWSVAWHALEVLDYDLAGELTTWSPPAPFAGHPHWQTFTSLPEAWSHAEIAGYLDHCRRRVRDSLTDMTQSRAATLLPATHRYAGTPYAVLLTSLIGHTTAHAIQIRQFTEGVESS